MKNLIYISAGCIFIFLFSLTCFQENQLEKLKIYNESDGDTLLPYIYVTAVTPPVNGVNVSINADISVQFDDNIDMSTVSAATFSVNGGAVTGVFSYNDQTKTVVFNPDSLAYNTVYTVTLSTGIENLVGDALASDYFWNFTTVAAPLPDIKVYSALGLFIPGGTWDYGSVLAGESKTATFTIENSGSAVLDISGMAISGTDAALFAVNPLPVFPLSINPGNSSPVTVDFNPFYAGIKNALLAVNSNDPNNPAFIINLTGLGIASDASEIEISRSGTNIVSGITLTDFGTVPFGGSFQIEFLMKNIGSDNLIVSGFYSAGTDPGFFSTDFPAAPFVLNPDQSQIFHIILTAGTVKENIKAEFVFENNDSDEAVFILKLKGKVK
jgi:hypothetical protein